MKTNTLMLAAIISLYVAASAHADNIIRVMAPINGVPEGAGGQVWLPATPSYGDWMDSGSFYGCTNWIPPANEVAVTTLFTQTATDCKQDQSRSVQAREIQQASGIYRNVGEATSEWRSFSATAQRSTTGTKEYWVMVSPTYTSWQNSGAVYECTNWTPDAASIDFGVGFTQEATDCKQNQTRYRQNRAQETTTLAYRNEGDQLLESQTLTNQSSSRSAVGAKSSGQSGSYFRIYIDSNNGSSYAQMAEVELLDANGVDLFDQHSVVTSQSSFYSNGYSADKLIDNTGGNNKWTSVGGEAVGSWVTFKLAVNVSYKNLVIWNFISTSESSRQPKDFKFQVSNDNGATWSTIKTFTGATNWLDSEKRVFNLAP